MRLRSLSARLAVWIGVLGLLEIAAALLFSFVTIDRELNIQQRAVLQDKVGQVAPLVGSLPNAAALGENAYKFAELLAGHAEMHLVVAAAGTQAPQVSFSPEAVESLARLKRDVWGTDAYLEWKSTETGVRMLSLAAAGQTHDGEQYEIVLSVDRAQNDQLLQRFGVTALIAAPLVVVVVGLSALAIVVVGLRPLQRFRQTAASVTTSNLSKRINQADLPSELQGLCATFNAMLDRLDNGVRRLSEFSGDLAHEMRTPLATALGRAQVALSQPRTVEQLADVLASNVDEMQRLARLITDMLFLAQADRAEAALELTKFDLADEARKVVEFLEVLAEERGATATVDGTGIVTADRGLVQRAIMNLVANALRHCTASSQVRVVASSGVGGVDLTVSNRGEAIAPEHRERLFERFYRVDSARTRDAGGTGLGLAIVKAIMVLHGGSVSVERSAQDETQFILHFPRR